MTKPLKLKIETTQPETFQEAMRRRKALQSAIEYYDGNKRSDKAYGVFAELDNQAPNIKPQTIKDCAFAVEYFLETTKPNLDYQEGDLRLLLNLTKGLRDLSSRYAMFERTQESLNEIAETMPQLKELLEA